MKITKNMALMMGFYFLSFIAFAVPYAYMQTFLSYVGYDVAQRGIILSGVAVVAIVLQFVVGYLCDKYQTDKKFFNLLLIFLTVATFVMYTVTKQMFFLHLIFASLVGGISRTIMIVQDTWCIETDEACERNFGPIRAFGAIGWVIGTPVAAMLIERFGYESLGIIFAGMAIVNFLYTLLMQDAIKDAKSASINFDDVKKLVVDRKYVIVVLLFLFINIIDMSNMYTVNDKLIELGANESMIGARWSIQAITEIPLFFAGAFLLAKFGDFKLMVFGTIMYMVRFVFTAVAPTPEFVIAASLLQGVTYPLIMITSKTIVNSATPVYLRASGQTIAAAIYIGVSSLVTPALSGVLIASIGVDMTLICFGLLGFVVLLLALVYKRT